MGLINKDDGWRMPDEFWAEIEPLLPPGKPHPLGCNRPRDPNRSAMDAILFVLRTGCQWNALDATRICSCSSDYRRFREWLEAGVFEALWRRGVLEYDRLEGIDWHWLSVDGVMTKAPLGGKKPDRPPPIAAKAAPTADSPQALKHEAGVKARRGVVERAHRWLNRFRRLLVCWEKRGDTYLAMLHLALAIITWRPCLSK